MYKTVEFNMIYALMSIISFVAIYALLGGPALAINSWLGDQNQFIQPEVLSNFKLLLKKGRNFFFARPGPECQSSMQCMSGRQCRHRDDVDATSQWSSPMEREIFYKLLLVCCIQNICDILSL